jgi:hypothetical protein
MKRFNSHKMRLMLVWTATFGLIVAFSGMAFGAETATLYDNTELGFIPDRATGPGNSKERIAQPFRTGDFDNVSAVTIELNGSHGSPTGVLSVEIWDDDGSGTPSKLIGVVGTLELSTLANGWAFYTLDDPVTALSPNTRYFVLLNYTNANINNSNSAGVATYESSLGTQGADLLLGSFEQSGYTWKPMNTYFTGNFFSHMRMAVYTAFAVVDFNGNGTVDIQDLLRLIESWDQNDPAVDIGPTPFGDGVVDNVDLEVLMSHWGNEVSDPTLLACWKLDETKGTVAYDSAVKNDGIVLGNPVWQSEDGQVGGALAFDGVDDVIIVDPVLNPEDGPFSVFAWIKGGAPGQTIVSQEGGVNWLQLDVAGTVMTELTKSDGRTAGIPLYSETVITDGNWHRIGFVWDGSQRSLYVDDMPVAEETLPNLAGASKGLRIGTSSKLEAGSFWSGMIDDVRIYNRAVEP